MNYLDKTGLIQAAREHIRLKNSNSDDILKILIKAISENNSNPEQQAELIALKKEIDDLPTLNLSFFGSSAVSL